MPADTNRSKASRNLNRIKQPSQRRAAVSWLRRHRESADQSVLERLSRDWAYAARRHGNAHLRQQLYFVLFDRLARLPLGRLPSVTMTRYLVRSLRRFPSTASWESLNSLLRDKDTPVLPAEWKPNHRESRRLESARRSAKVTFAEMVESLEQWSAFFAAGDQPLPLEQTPTSLDSLTAFTDGRTIHLPEAIAVSPHAVLNQFAYVRLLGHEYLHQQLGHFDFSFRTDGGREVWTRLAPRRQMFRANREAWDRTKVLNQLLASGEYVPDSKEASLPSLLAFLMHFETASHSGVHGLLNVVLDALVERQLARSWPGLGEIAGIICEYEQTLRPDPRFLSAADNFQLMILDRALGRESVAHVTQAYRPAFESAAPILDSLQQGPIGTIYDGVNVTLDLIDVMERELPQGAKNETVNSFAPHAPVAMEEVSIRRELTAERWDPEKPARKAKYPFGLEHDPPGRGDWYPEFDAWKNTLEERAVFVVENPWAAFRAPYDLSPSWNFRPFALNSTDSITRMEPVQRSEGIDLDMDRFHDFVVAFRSGHQADDRVFLDDLDVAARAPKLAVTFAVDLTVSMEAVRSRHSSAAPIVLAIETVESMAASLEKSGVPTAIWGVHDVGRRPVTIWRGKDFDEPFNVPRLRSLHAIGVGGFRMGAIVRHAAADAARRLPGRSHLLVLVTDAASHYHTVGVDTFMRDKIISRGCRHCQMRRAGNCWVEPIEPRIDLRKQTPEVKDLNLFYPTFYEFSDTRHAIQSSPNLAAWLIVIGTHYSKKSLDDTFGKDRWTTLLSRSDYPRVRRTFGRVIQQVAHGRDSARGLQGQR